MTDSVFVVKSRALPYRGIRSGTIRYGTQDTGQPNGSNDTKGSATDTLLAESWNGSEVTRSDNHPGWGDAIRSRRFTGDIGGEFFSQKKYVLEKIQGQTFSGWKTSDGRFYSYCTYSGAVLPRAPGLADFPPYQASSNAQLDPWGAKAIARCKPTNATADTSVALGELLREGIPDLSGASLSRWREGTKAARKATAEEYLNYQFGWVPIRNDVNQLVGAVMNAHRIMTQFERDSGKLVRRRFEFQPEILTETTEVVGANTTPYIRPSHTALFTNDSAKGTVYRRTTVARRRWFAGAFTYYTPKDYSLRSRVVRATQASRKVFGLSLTPDVVWNLSPWSWAVDWFTNVGDVLSNVTDMVIYGLVLKYGYIMEHVVSTVRYSFGGPTRFIDGNVRPQVVTLVSETKVRHKATPFGFGLTWSGLNPVQVAIAAALGITRS
jgi:hypothetical protein